MNSLTNYENALPSSFEEGQVIYSEFRSLEDGSDLAKAMFENSDFKNHSVPKESNKICNTPTPLILKSNPDITAFKDCQTNKEREPLQSSSSCSVEPPLSSDIQGGDSLTKTDKSYIQVPKITTSIKNQMKEAILRCEWNMCIQTVQKMDKFLVHIAGHVATANDPSVNEGNICLWRSCGFNTHSRCEFERHIYFHAFHAKIKGIGEVVRECLNLECTIDEQSHNVIPEIPEPFECMWYNCNFNFTSAQDFYWHVHGHVFSIEKEKGETQFPCSWKGCTFQSKVLYRVHEHVRRHTQEKVVGCPSCGAIFSAMHKYKDHCYRHKAQELQSFECSYCKCKFATERLLKEHVRRHINHFKCPHCEMTCTTRATLEMHIKYRHTNNKPHKCPECSKRFKHHIDVAKHLPSHSVEPSYVCFYPECLYSCRSYSSYCYHLKKVHEGSHTNSYICHMCDKTFCKGSSLTRHLKKIHDYHWPAGHTRFRYRKDEEGYYRLQTTRFESMELAQEFLKETDENPDDPDSDIEGDSNSNIPPKENDVAENSSSQDEQSVKTEEKNIAEQILASEPSTRKGNKRKRKST